MIIDINIHNSSLSFQNQSIDLSSKGVYLVTGPNGIGKTTVLKNIVFSKHFADTNRNHFSYAEQDPEKYDISIKNYISRYNPGINTEKVEELLDKFDLKHLNTNKSIMNVSGGELVKLNIIAALVKESDFVFLDEPTNNLDNESVDRLKTILIDYTADKIAVVVSHDPRLNDIRHHSITISKEKISVEYASNAHPTEHHNNTEKQRIKYPWLRILLKHFLRPFSIINIVLLFAYSALFLFINHNTFVKFYDADDIASKDGSVLLYSVDLEYGELSQLLSKCENIDVNEERYYSRVQYKDIPNLVSKFNLENVFILDRAAYDSIFSAQIKSSSTPIISIPNIAYGYSHQILPVINSEYLAEGRYPDENKSEIVTSQNIIDRLFPGCSLGDKLLWNGSEYELVGIHFLDIIIESYKYDVNGIFYRYSPDTYDAFVEEQVEFEKSIDAPIEFIYSPDSMIIQTDISSEHSALRGIFTDFPANNYRSYSYDKVLSDYHNKTLFSIMLIINIGTGLLFGIVFILVNKRRTYLFRTEAMSIDNYYLTKPLTMKLFGIGDTVLNVIIYITYMVVALNYVSYGNEIPIMAIGFGLLCLVSSIPYCSVTLKKHD